MSKQRILSVLALSLGALLIGQLWTARAAHAGGIVAEGAVAPKKATPDAPATVELRLRSEWISEAAQADLLLVLDESGSVSPIEWNQLRTACGALIESLPPDALASGRLRVGVVTFSMDARVAIRLDAPPQDLAARVRTLQPRGGATNHAAGIKACLEMIRGNAPGRQTAMILVTDGKSTHGAQLLPPLLREADSLGLERFVLGVGSGYLSELGFLASAPVAAHVRRANAYADTVADLGRILEDVKRPGGTSIVVQGRLKPHVLVSEAEASRGSVTHARGIVTWNLAALGGDPQTLRLRIYPSKDSRGGPTDVFETLEFQDAEGHLVSWPRMRVFLAGRPAQLQLTPVTPTQELGKTQRLSARVVDADGQPCGEVPLQLEVSAGPHMGRSMIAITDLDGTAHFDFLGTKAIGKERIWVRTLEGADVRSNLIQVTWTGTPVPDADPDGIQPSDGPASSPAESETMSYDVRIKTSDIYLAGSDGGVHLSILGSRSRIENLHVNAQKNLRGSTAFFVQGKTDHVVVADHPHLGDLTSIQLRFTPKGWGPAWHAAEITIRERAGAKRTFRFRVGRWIEKAETITIALAGD